MAAAPTKRVIPPRLARAPEVTPVTPRPASPELLWADKTVMKVGDTELIEAPGKGKRIVIYFYRRGNMGGGENVVVFKFGDKGEGFWKMRMWYCGVEIAGLLYPRKGPENTPLIVNLLTEHHPIDVSIGYKIETI